MLCPKIYREIWKFESENVMESCVETPGNKWVSTYRQGAVSLVEGIHLITGSRYQAFASWSVTHKGIWVKGQYGVFVFSSSCSSDWQQTTDIRWPVVYCLRRNFERKMRNSSCCGNPSANLCSKFCHFLIRNWLTFLNQGLVNSGSESCHGVVMLF